MDDIAGIYLMGMDHSFIGCHHVQQSFHQSSREDTFASTAVPSLGGYGIAELEPFKSQARGFEHGHRKKYAIPKPREREVIQLFKEKDEAELHSLLHALKTALLRCAETTQYEASTLPASQMTQSVLPEKFTKKQQTQSRLDGGVELDGTSREILATSSQFWSYRNYELWHRFDRRRRQLQPSLVRCNPSYACLHNRRDHAQAHLS